MIKFPKTMKGVVLLKDFLLMIYRVILARHIICPTGQFCSGIKKVIKIVFDASYACNSPSLNDCLYPGLNLLAKKFYILLVFRLS